MKQITDRVWLFIGLVSLLSGIAGILLPLVPTTPFILLSAFAFARSSPRLHCWLVTHARFGPIITNWERYGAISRRTKIVAVAVIALTPILTLMIGAPLWALVAQILVLAGVVFFIVTRPEGDGTHRTKPDA